ncbi:MAG TPA: hypothetical protein VEX87_23895, partial [Skermanella sp.]|nr:hypothetical protein [Skermanella sp.]
KLWMDGRTNWAEFGADGLTNGFAKGTAAGWEMDTAHQPALNYLPYLVTGSQYYLDGLMAQSSYSIASYAPHYRGWDDGFIDFDQVRGRAWTWRNMSDSAFIAPDDSELKTYFNDMLENNMDALVKRYITDGAMNKYGQIEGFFRHDMWPDGDLLVWQSDFVAMVLGSIAERGNTQAVELLKWMDNFTSGRFIHGDDGFDPRFGAAYMLKVNSTGNGPVYTTWADFFKGSFGSSPTVPAEGIMGTPTSPYGYAANAKAAVASIFSATQSPDAMEAFGFLAKSIVQAKGAVSFFGDPTWNIAPKLSDGTHLNFDSIRITSSSGNQTLNGSDINELIHGSSGNDAISGGKGIDILFGGDGDDGLNGGPGDDFLYGGNGNDRISGGGGNDYLKGNAGSDTFVFGADAGGRDRIGDFRPGTDFLEIKSDLNGNGLKSASQILGTATTDADSNAVLHLGGGVEIVLIGVHASDLKADMIHMN